MARPAAFELPLSNRTNTHFAYRQMIVGTSGLLAPLINRHVSETGSGGERSAQSLDITLNISVSRFFDILRATRLRPHEHTRQLDRREGQGDEPRPFGQQQFIKNALPPFQPPKKYTLKTPAARTPERSLNRDEPLGPRRAGPCTDQNRRVTIGLPVAVRHGSRDTEAL